MGRGEAKYPEMMRVRIPKEWKDRLQRILETREHGDLSELGREAIIRLVEAEEERLKITTENKKR